ncbi:hypothetical protein ACTJIJ_14900 [Niabella sp. 22666]|uniref:hypothetical protein n=1 Tax=Niabella sp. 22666 TaxID=3453954 RepID=UPI003F83D42F
MKIRSLSTFLLLCLSMTALCQPARDTINYKLINNLALKGEVRVVLSMLDTLKLYRPPDILYKQKLENRFKYKKDKSDFLKDVPTSLRGLLGLYQRYWRMCLLDNTKVNDSLFRSRAIQFYQRENLKSIFTKETIRASALEKVANDYIFSKGYSANDFGRTGFLYDLIIWKDFQAKSYDVQLIEDTVSVKVNFINTFISLGWLAYARMGKGPGGWATDKELFCVADLYSDHASEKFQISYLKHEGQHFYDFKHFPDLPGKDLEYRAKLAELFFSKEQLLDLIASFKEGAKKDITNAHPFANYCIIRDLSKMLFRSDYEQDLSRWKAVDRATIQKAVKELYLISNAESKNGHYLQ